MSGEGTRGARTGTGDARVDALARLVAVIDRLRDPEGGCPWDLEQTVESIAPSAVEEAHELVEAIEQGDEAGAVEEAGDVLLVVTLLARIAEQAGRFDLARAAGAASDKLVRRHPHVFGDVSVHDAPHAIANWERIKAGERAAERADASALAGVPVALPALQRADRLGAKAIAAGFRWTDARGALAKLTEEVGELREAAEAAWAQSGGVAGEDADEARRARLESELGDVLLAGALFGRYVGVDPERALRGAVRRFEARFRHMESELAGDLRDAPLPQLLEAWQRAKMATADER